MSWGDMVACETNMARARYRPKMSRQYDSETQAFIERRVEEMADAGASGDELLLYVLGWFRRD